MPDNREPQADPIDPRIEKFIRKHNVMTLATSSADGSPWCCQLFYAYMVESGTLVFSSSSTTRHAQQAIADNRIAGSIVLESRIVSRLQGVQFSGTIARANDQGAERKAYLHRFPYAAPMLEQLWIVRLDNIKYTDNTLGFGTKLLWQRQK